MAHTTPLTSILPVELDGNWVVCVTAALLPSAVPCCVGSCRHDNMCCALFPAAKHGLVLAVLTYAAGINMCAVCCVLCAEWEEWGNPKNKEYYDYIKSYSPVDNVKAQE